ncbi:MAG: aminoglycoside phosphotransferase family protein [Mycobacterium sp.]|nr:aminoglycoside phosphotransferase family protein [Mycobacterium sp.]
MRTSSGADILVDGDVVVKIHRTGTDPDALAARLRAAARLGGGDGPLLAPLSASVSPAPGGRWMTRWPRVHIVGRDPGALPWAAAGELLAVLHTRPGTGGLPAHRAAERLHRALERLPADAPPVIRQAARTVAPRAGQPCAPDRPRTVVHGDFHLGQLGARTGGPWQLIDVDDLGLGDPAWDLARPAGLWAAGLIPHADFHDFLDGYRSAAGPAIPTPGDPWEVLEPFARAAVVHAAAVGARYPEDESQAELLAACERMI